VSDARFELVATLYVLCMDYHGGQWSRGYRLMSRIARRYRRVSITNAYAAELRAGELYATLARRYAARL
jgi:hypothetical protein